MVFLEVCDAAEKNGSDHSDSGFLQFIPHPVAPSSVWLNKHTHTYVHTHAIAVYIPSHTPTRTHWEACASELNIQDMIHRRVTLQITNHERV